MSLGSLSLILALAVVALLIVGLPALLLFGLAKVIRGAPGQNQGRSAATSADEAQLVQEIHHSLEGLERRIDSLETILIKHESNEEVSQ